MVLLRGNIGILLPSSVLSGKYPYEMIYKNVLLSHLRVFGCLCFVTLVNSSDKFGSRSEKCVLIGYSSVKKGYRLYSLDKHQFIFSRDVKFFENIFPFKDSDKVKDVTEKVFQDVNHINFFDLEYPETPNDDERVDPKLNCDNKKSQSASSSSFESGGISVTASFLVNSGNNADNNFDTQDEGVTTLQENSWPIFQLDVNNAFLYGDLDEVVYMRPPEGYFPSGNKVCKLKKFLYGLKQAPRQWNAKLTSTLIENGFSQSKSDYSFFTKTDKGVFLALLVYVGLNLLSVTMLLKLKSLRKYVLDLLSEYGMLACKPVDTPLLSKLIISNEALCNLILRIFIDYHKFMGYPNLPNLNTRVTISYLVHCLSQFMHSPLKSHLKTAFKILRYLKGCLGLGIHFVKTSGMFLSAFSYADWAKCVITRKSVTGYCVFFNSSLISWKSKKQNTLSKSSTEAEYRALASVTSEVIWILNFLKDLKIENLLPVNLHCDSNSAIKIAANPVFHERTKHLEIDLHFVREIFLKGVVKTVKVDSANQIANVFTKGLGTIQHKNFLEKLGMYDIYQNACKILIDEVGFHTFSYMRSRSIKLLLAEEKFLKIKQVVEEEQNQPEYLQELLQSLLKDLQILNEISPQQAIPQFSSLLDLSGFG
ncbi:ribonuclease H-like domain-containing protein [Tanacetum coccineum]